MERIQDNGYVHIVGCVDAEEAGASIKGRTVDYGIARKTVSAVLARVGEHVGGEWQHADQHQHGHQQRRADL